MIRKRLILALAATLLAVQVHAQIFNSNLSASDAARLNSSEPVINYINDAQKICIVPNVAPKVEALRSMMFDLKPNYLAEVLYSAPVAGNENLPEQVERIFNDIELYKQIRFFPHATSRPEEFTMLFSIADELSRKQADGKTTIGARFKMDPLSKYNADLSLERADDGFLFIHRNTSSIRYLGISVISPDSMRAGLAVVRDGDRWLVYAAGGLNAWKPSLIAGKLERMFNDRIRDFVKFYLGQVEIKR